MEENTQVNKPLRLSIAEWARLARSHTIAASAAVMFIGYVTVSNMSFDIALLVFIVSALIHTSGCILNDYYDFQYDKMDEGKAGRPLVRGTISPRRARDVGYFIVLFALAFSFYISYTVGVVSLISASLGLYYNANSKDNIISEFAFAGWEASLAVIGAAIAGGWTTLTSLFVIFIFIQAFYQIQEGSMKDIKGDERTLLSAIGVKVLDNGHVYYPFGFKFVTYAVKSLQLLVLGYMIYLQRGVIDEFVPVSVIVISIAVGVNVILFSVSLNGWLVDKYSRESVIQYFTLHELSGAMLALLSVLPSDPDGIILLLFLIPSWVIIVNIGIHKGAISPDI